ncbi:MAG: 2-amino-4-hydroxy-6-hydroxymethyldihydropteridine diphosphokinase [Steroidobacteraceae bacterium]|jgi:2-amino-4-hydroxy-6-hydroxymethyldihydropteridine diphosphokinase|nr:2-amino-4-hydroxy-6-hydroxymethyldihydropteridine diphosphokinase [Steroidobacteraceae bacterium]
MTPAGRWFPAYVALGSNLGDPRAQVERAFDALAALPDTRLVARSRLYGAKPVGPQDQPDFVNACAALITRLDAPALHAELRALETRLGKVPPAVRYGPRTIDLDLLVHHDTELATDALVVPHPRLHERGFVLYPLHDVAPDLQVPRCGRVRALVAALESSGQAGGVEPL